MTRPSADGPRRRAGRLIDRLKRGELDGLEELSILFGTDPPDINHAHADAAVYALARCFESHFLSSADAPTERDRTLVWLGLNVAWDLMYARVRIHAPLAERGIVPILRACDEHWQALATLGSADDRAALVDARGVVARFACVISTRLADLAVLGDLMPRLTPKLLAVAAELLDGAEMNVWLGVQGLRRQDARVHREMSSAQALTAALRTVRLFAKYEPARVALCTPVATSALGCLVKKLGDWASRPASHDEPGTIANAGYASELVDILRCLSAADGGPTRLMRIGATQPLAAILRGPLSVQLVVPLAAGVYEARHTLRADAAAALTPLAKLEGSSGRAARADLWAKRVPHAALRVILDPVTDAFLAKNVAMSHKHEVECAAVLAHALLTDVGGMTSALKAAHAALRVDLYAAVGHPFVPCKERALLEEALACFDVPSPAAGTTWAWWRPWN